MAPSDNDLPKVGDTIAAKYRIEQVLGRGGMGAVFRVTHAVTGKSFAVKWLLPHLNTGHETAQRFIREAQVAGRVDHPNVVEVYDIGEDRGSMYMVMELLHGESLAQYITRVGRIPYSQACQLLIGVTRGLAAAHRSGVIHRDLKPDNIFLSISQNHAREPRPKILDFGISKISALATDANPALTREGVVMGTPHYMAPEQLRSHKLDDRCDIYALGVIMYQMLSGKLPFASDNFPDLMLKIVSETPTALGRLAPDVPSALIAIVETAMARSPAERFDSAADLGRALEPFGEGASYDIDQPVTVRPPSSILPAATTPVATESRFPPTAGRSVNTLERARRLVVRTAASVVSAALACWLYVSFDNQNAGLHARIDAADGGKRVQRSAAQESGTLIAPPVSSASTAASSSTLPAPQHGRAVVQPRAATSDPDALPEPHITTLAAAEPTPSKAAAEPEIPPSLIGAGGLPQPTPATPESLATSQLTANATSSPTPEPTAPITASISAAQRNANPNAQPTGASTPPLSSAAPRGNANALPRAASTPPLSSAAQRGNANALPRVASAPPLSSAAQRGNANDPPSPMPPPGAAAPPELGVVQPLKAAANAKPRRPAAKKPSAKFESPEIRINDFFK